MATVAVVTKRDAAIYLVGIAQAVHRSGGDDVDISVLRLLWVAEGLSQHVVQLDAYRKLLVAGGESRLTKLRRLIEHPATPSSERDAAVAALARIREAR